MADEDTPGLRGPAKTSRRELDEEFDENKKKLVRYLGNLKEMIQEVLTVYAYISCGPSQSESPTKIK